MSDPDTARGRNLSDEQLLDLLQRRTFRYFWEGAHPESGLAFDRLHRTAAGSESPVAVGGSGFGAMATVVACERGWITREQALGRFARMLDCLERASRYHGMYPHFMRGDTGATVPFSAEDDGGDLMETALLLQGLLCARAYFDSDAAEELRLRQRITTLWHEVEWDWYTRGRNVLTWHWSAVHGFALDLEIRGWNECLIAYVLAAGSPRHAVTAQAYHEGWARGRDFLNRGSFAGIELPLGPDWGGPLFFAHYSFCGIDPRGLSDRYADYWQQNLNHTRINYAYCLDNPRNYRGYGRDCWGLTAGDSVAGYAAHAPANDLGVITPAAALSSFVYAPREAMAALRHLFEDLGDRIWGDFGFVDGFSEEYDWYADTFLAIDQGPIIAMIENYRSGLLWKLFMGIPEVRSALEQLGFRSPYLA